MHAIKKKYVKDNIYIYECWNCQNPLMLHQEKCASCTSHNDYFDKSLKVSKEVHDAVMQDLKKFMKEIPAIKLP